MQSKSNFNCIILYIVISIINNTIAKILDYTVIVIYREYVYRSLTVQFFDGRGEYKSIKIISLAESMCNTMNTTKKKYIFCRFRYVVKAYSDFI